MRQRILRFYDVVFRGKAPAWTALFTCVLAVFTYFLWKVSNEAHKTLTATQAASVTSLGPALFNVPSDDGKTLKGYNVIFSWVNSGTTPTRTIIMQSNVTVGHNIPSKASDFNSLPQSESTTAVLGPKVLIQGPPTFVKLQDFEDVAQGKTRMFFWGWAVYKDVFSDTPRLSEYCFDVRGATWTKSDHADLASGINLVNPPCGVHFCFNEECENYKTRTK